MVMVMLNAHIDGHPRLYHYQPFTDPETDKFVNRLETTLRDGTIYMSRPSGFNDPWDFKPWFNMDVLDDPDEFARHQNWLLGLPHVANAPEAADEIQRDPRLLRAGIEAIRDGYVRELDQQYRVYCMSPDPLIPLMWAHYGGSHRGVALEFDTCVDQLVGAYRVYYRDEYPPVRLYDEDANNAILVPVFTKSAVWRYENEYRLVASEHGPVNPDMEHTENSVLRLRDGALSGLVIGCLCDTDHVLDLVDRHAPHLRVRKAVRLPDRYELSFQTLRAGRLRA